MQPIATNDGMMEPILRLDRDLKAAARQLGQRQARSLVDFFYQIQDFRTNSANKQRGAGPSEPNALLDWTYENMHRFENDIKRAMDAFTDEWMVGRWMKSIVGIGPILSAGMLAHLDIRRAKTAGHFWSFAGWSGDGQAPWLGKGGRDELVKQIEEEAGKQLKPRQLVEAIAKATHRRPELLLEMAYQLAEDDDGNRPEYPTRTNILNAASLRPWNAKFRLLCWKLGDVMCKMQRHDDDVYGHLYVARREYETPINDRGGYAHLAKASLEEKNWRRDTETKQKYLEGKLPNARLHLRAIRYCVKIFLSHLHHVMHVDFYGRDPDVPYVFAKCPGDHRHFIPIPNWPFEDGGRSLKELLR